MKLPTNSKSIFVHERGLLKDTKKKNQDAINDHAKSVIHLNIIANLKENFKNLKKKQRLTANSNDYLDVTSKMFRTVYVVNKFALPFSDHEKLVNLQKINGINLGFHHYERSGCTAITNHISEQMHEILINNLLKSKMPISIIIDDTTDAGNVHFKIVYFQTIENSNPVIYFYKLIETKSETGLAGFEALRSAWISEERKDFHKYMEENLIGFASDGAPANLGRHNGVIKFLRDWAKSPIFAIHCMAHRLELAIQHAFDSMKDIENMNKISYYLDDTIKKTYSFYNGQGFKRKNHLRVTCDKYNKKFYSLSDVIAIRWVASDYSAMKSIHSMWKALVHDLHEIEFDSVEFEVKTRQKANKRRSKLIGKHFLLMFYFIFDIVSELSVVSQNMQRRESLVVNIQSHKINLDSIFNYLSTEDGKYLKLFLSEVQCETDFDPDILESCRTVGNYLNSNMIKYEDVVLIDDKGGIPDVNQYRKKLIEALLKQLDAYFPDGHLNNFMIFDPKKMPESDGYVALRMYGLIEIKELNKYFQICNEDKILNEWQSLLESIVSCPNYCTIKSSQTSVSAFWGRLLKWSDISWGSCTKRLVHTVFSIPVSSAEAERGFSILKYVRDSQFT